IRRTPKFPSTTCDGVCATKDDNSLRRRRVSDVTVVRNRLSSCSSPLAVIVVSVEVPTPVASTIVTVAERSESPRWVALPSPVTATVIVVNVDAMICNGPEKLILKRVDSDSHANAIVDALNDISKVRIDRY